MISQHYFGIAYSCTPNPMLIIEALIWELPKIGVPYFGVLIIRILLFRVQY